MKTVPVFTQQNNNQKLKLPEVLEQINRHDDFRRMINMLKDNLAAQGDQISGIQEAFRSKGERRRFWAAYIRLAEMLLKCKPFRKMKEATAITRVQLLLFNFEEFRIHVYKAWAKDAFFDEESQFSFLTCDLEGEIQLPKTIKKFSKKQKLDMTGCYVINEISNYL